MNSPLYSSVRTISSSYPNHHNNSSIYESYSSCELNSSNDGDFYQNNNRPTQWADRQPIDSLTPFENVISSPSDVQEISYSYLSRTPSSPCCQYETQTPDFEERHYASQSMEQQQLAELSSSSSSNPHLFTEGIDNKQTNIRIRNDDITQQQFQNQYEDFYGIDQGFNSNNNNQGQEYHQSSFNEEIERRHNNNNNNNNNFNNNNNDYDSHSFQDEICDQQQQQLQQQQLIHPRLAWENQMNQISTEYQPPQQYQQPYYQNQVEEQQNQQSYTQYQQQQQQSQFLTNFQDQITPEDNFNHAYPNNISYPNGLEPVKTSLDHQRAIYEQIQLSAQQNHHQIEQESYLQKESVINQSEFHQQQLLLQIEQAGSKVNMPELISKVKAGYILSHDEIKNLNDCERAVLDSLAIWSQKPRTLEEQEEREGEEDDDQDESQSNQLSGPSTNELSAENVQKPMKQVELKKKLGGKAIKGVPQKILRRNKIVKREEEKQKMVFKKAFKHIEQAYYKKHIKKSRISSKDKDPINFYKFYFGELSERNDIPLNEFFHPEKQFSKQDKKASGKKTFNQKYINLILQSQPFLIQVEDYIEQVMIKQISTEHDQKLAKMLSNMSKQYESLRNNINLDRSSKQSEEFELQSRKKMCQISEKSQYYSTPSFENEGLTLVQRESTNKCENQISISQKFYSISRKPDEFAMQATSETRTTISGNETFKQGESVETPESWKASLHQKIVEGLVVFIDENSKLKLPWMDHQVNDAIQLAKSLIKKHKIQNIGL